jgi:hypothetical protein
MRENRLAVLNNNDVSFAEFSVMSSVGYHIFYPPNKLAQVGVKLSEGDLLGEPTLDEHLKAIDSCLEKGWLKILTAEEYEQIIASQQSAVTPEIIDYPEPNTVDFTPKGYSLYRQIIFETFGEEHIQRSDAGWNIDEDSQVANIYAETTELCEACIKEFADNPSSYTGKATEIVNVSQIESIGAWKPNRFITLPQGFHAGVSYKLIEC